MRYQTLNHMTNILSGRTKMATYVIVESRRNDGKCHAWCAYKGRWKWSRIYVSGTISLVSAELCEEKLRGVLKEDSSERIVKEIKINKRSKFMASLKERVKKLEERYNLCIDDEMYPCPENTRAVASALRREIKRLANRIANMRKALSNDINGMTKALGVEYFVTPEKSGYRKIKTKKRKETKA